MAASSFRSGSRVADHDHGAVVVVVHAHADAVELAEDLRPQHLRRRSLRHQMTFVQQRQTVGVEAGEREVVHRRHHCQPALVPHAINQFQPAVRRQLVFIASHPDSDVRTKTATAKERRKAA